MTELGISQIRSEKRAAAYTDVLVDAIIRHASGSLTLNPAGLGVLEAASGMLGRALSLASVDPQNARTAALTPSTRARIGRDLLRHGESVHVIHIGRDGLELVPAHAVDVSGQPFGEWRYKLDVAGPDGAVTRDYPASSVLHVRLASDATSPWAGVPPLAWAVTSARLGTAIETRAAQEADGPVGNLITAPRDPGPPADETDEETDPHAGLKRDLASLRGELALVETAANTAEGTTRRTTPGLRAPATRGRSSGRAGEPARRRGALSSGSAGPACRATQSERRRHGRT